MRKSLLAAAIVLLVSPAFAAAVSQQDIDRAIGSRLTFSVWGTASDLVLTKDGRYTLKLSCLGCAARVCAEGRYELAGGKVLLKQESCRDDDTGKPLDSAENYAGLALTTEKSEGDLYYTQYLVLEASGKRPVIGNLARLRFGMPDTKVPAGSRRSYDGMPVVTMGMQKGVTTTNAKIRVKPSTGAKPVQYLDSPFGPSSPKESVPAGTPLVVRARTAEKEQVGQWNNYWYLVDVGVHENVWIFGELVKLGK